MNIRHKATAIRLRDFHSVPMKAFHIDVDRVLSVLFRVVWHRSADGHESRRIAFDQEQVGNSAIAAVAITILVRMLMGWLCEPDRAEKGLHVAASTRVATRNGCRVVA